MAKRQHFISLATVMLIVLTACSQFPLQQEAVEPVAKPETATTLATPATEPVSQTLTAETIPTHSKQQQIIEMGNGQFLAQESAPAISKEKDGDITLNFQDTDIREFIKVILGDVLNQNYVIDPKVAGKVTIETTKPLHRDNLLDVLEDILSINNAALVKDSDSSMYKVVQKNQAIKGNLAPTVTQTADGYSVRIIPLTFIAAQEMQKILEPFITEGNDLRIDKKRNLVIVSGTQQEIDLIQDTINIFDVDWLRGMSVGLYPLDYVDPKTLKTELDSIIGAVDGEEGGELLGGLVRTVAIERLHSILLISSTPAALREVEIWVHRLDRQGDQVGKRLYVYNVQNAKATELGEILGHIFGTGSSTTVGQSRAAELAPGLTPVEIGDDTQAAPNTNNDSTNASSSSSSVTASSDGVSLPTSDDINIIADDTRNALVVMATPQDYRMVEQAIKKLDVVPLQVLIEASIIEVTLNDDLSYGVEWFFKNTIERSNVAEGRGTLDLGASGISALNPGFSYTILDTADQVRVALNALQEESEINVLSSPSLMVLDNQTALINVGDEIPVPTRQSISNIDPNSPTVNEIQFRQTGVTLTVTPRVNNGGLVTMEIRQEVSNAVTTTSSNIDAPTIQQRQVESTVAINSGDTIVLGGLIQDSQSDLDSGIPILKNIPLLGKLFSQTTLDNRRTELLVLLTPRVITNRQEAKDVTEEFKRKLRGLEPLS